MTEIPQAAIDAAAEAYLRPAVSVHHAMRAALEAAAPLIAAAERERLKGELMPQIRALLGELGDDIADLLHNPEGDPDAT